jgi:hypothetical protein
MLKQSGVLEETSDKAEAAKMAEAWKGLFNEIAPAMERAINIASVWNFFDIQVVEVSEFWHQVVFMRQDNAPPIPDELRLMIVRRLVMRRQAVTLQSCNVMRPVSGNNRGRSRANTGAARTWMRGGERV